MPFAHQRTPRILAGALLLSSLGPPAWAQQIEEVVVTARFKAENLQNVGASIQAIDAEALEREGVKDFEDIARRSAGISLTDRGPNQNDVSVRGIANGTAARLADLGSSGPLVSQFLDDVPVAAATASQRDFNYFDFDRVEILRGPQPTLFGEGSVGGTIRYFTRDPRLAGDPPGDVSIKASTSYTEDGGTNYAASGAASFVVVPDSLAIRGVVNYRKDDGFIDNPRLQQDDINDYEARSARLVALWQIHPDVTARFMASVGADDLGETNAVDAAAPADRLRFSSPVDGAGEDDFELYTARLSYSPESFTASSITGWYERTRSEVSYDSQSSAAFGTFTRSPLTGTAVGDSTDESFTQELRFVTDTGTMLNITAGAYYQNAKYASHLLTNAPELAQDSVSGTQTLLIDQGNTVESEQYSAFVELSLAATQRLRFIAGARYVVEDITNTSTSSRVAAGTGGSPISPPFIINDVNRLATTVLGLPLEETFELEKVLPRVAVELDIGDDQMLYAIGSSGVRNGNLNPFTSAFQGSAGRPAAFASLRSFDEDEVRSYELGAKTRWLDGRLVVNAAAFHTRYENPQILTSNPLVLTVNGPDQKIRGAEIEATLRAGHALELYFAATYQDAEFDGAAVLGNPTLLAALGHPFDLESGSHPVGVPEWAASFGANFNYPLTAALSLTANGAYQFIDSRYATNQNFPSSRLDSQHFVNLRFGVAGEHWSVVAFGDNLTNDIAFQSIAGNNAAVFINADGALDFRPTAAAINRPRTIGIEMTYKY